MNYTKHPFLCQSPMSYQRFAVHLFFHLSRRVLPWPTPLFGVAALMFSASVAHADGEYENKVIYGLHEHVLVKELGVELPAKLDTGAESASLSAHYIKRFDRDGEKWVEFDLAMDKNDREELGLDSWQWDDVQMPISRHVRIKRRSENVDEGEKDYNRRPVVELTLCIGGREATVDVNLTDRRDFSYPLLVGSDALRKLNSLIDPSISMGTGGPRCAIETEPAVSDEEPTESDDSGDKDDKDDEKTSDDSPESDDQPSGKESD
ncbi:MAG: ATP-dependent zinc protease [Pseudomonadota bacterium]